MSSRVRSGTMSDVSRSISDLSPHKQALLELLLSDKQRRSRTRAIPSRPAGVRVPLSFAQRRLWFFDQLDPGNAAYIICEGIRLIGPLDLDALERSLTEIVRRHEVLRTVYILDDGEPYQES